MTLILICIDVSVVILGRKRIRQFRVIHDETTLGEQEVTGFFPALTPS